MGLSSQWRQITRSKAFKRMAESVCASNIQYMAELLNEELAVVFGRCLCRSASAAEVWAGPDLHTLNA